MWPFSRRAKPAASSAGGEPSEQSAGSPDTAGSPAVIRQRAPQAWESVPIIQRSVIPPQLTLAPQRFAHDLTSWQPPAPFLAPLTHAVSADAPTGSVGGIVRTLGPVHTEHTGPAMPVAAAQPSSAQALQRTFADPFAARRGATAAVATAPDVASVRGATPPPTSAAMAPPAPSALAAVPVVQRVTAVPGPVPPPVARVSDTSTPDLPVLRLAAASPASAPPAATTPGVVADRATDAPLLGDAPTPMDPAVDPPAASAAPDLPLAVPEQPAQSLPTQWPPPGLVVQPDNGGDAVVQRIVAAPEPPKRKLGLGAPLNLPPAPETAPLPLQRKTTTLQPTPASQPTPAPQPEPSPRPPAASAASPDAGPLPLATPPKAPVADAPQGPDAAPSPSAETVPPPMTPAPEPADPVVQRTVAKPDESPEEQDVLSPPEYVAAPETTAPLLGDSPIALPPADARAADHHGVPDSHIALPLAVPGGGLNGGTPGPHTTNGAPFRAVQRAAFDAPSLTRVDDPALPVNHMVTQMLGMALPFQPRMVAPVVQRQAAGPAPVHNSPSALTLRPPPLPVVPAPGASSGAGATAVAPPLETAWGSDVREGPSPAPRLNFATSPWRVPVADPGTAVQRAAFATNGYSVQREWVPATSPAPRSGGARGPTAGLGAHRGPAAAPGAQGGGLGQLARALNATSAQMAQTAPAGGMGELARVLSQAAVQIPQSPAAGLTGLMGALTEALTPQPAAPQSGGGLGPLADMMSGVTPPPAAPRRPPRRPSTPAPTAAAPPQDEQPAISAPSDDGGASAPPPQPSQPTAATGGESPGEEAGDSLGHPRTWSAEVLDVLSRRLYDGISRRIKNELRADRERAGRLTDVRR